MGKMLWKLRRSLFRQIDLHERAAFRRTTKPHLWGDDDVARGFIPGR